MTPSASKREIVYNALAMIFMVPSMMVILLLSIVLTKQFALDYLLVLFLGIIGAGIAIWLFTLANRYAKDRYKIGAHVMVQNNEKQAKKIVLDLVLNYSRDLEFLAEVKKYNHTMAWEDFRARADEMEDITTSLLAEILRVSPKTPEAQVIQLLKTNYEDYAAIKTVQDIDDFTPLDLKELIALSDTIVI